MTFTRAQIRLSVRNTHMVRITSACSRKDMNETIKPLKRENSTIMHCLNRTNLPYGWISFMDGLPRLRHVSELVRRGIWVWNLAEMHQFPVTMSYTQLTSLYSP